MPKLVFESVLRCTPEELWRFHQDVNALRLLTPPDSKVTIVGADTAVRNGALHELKVVKKGLPLLWRARISDVIEGRQFRDTAEKSPFASWTHLHEFLPDPDGAILRDTVEYSLPFGPLGAIVDKILVRRDIEQMFAFRHRVTREACERGVSASGDR